LIGVHTGFLFDGGPGETGDASVSVRCSRGLQFRRRPWIFETPFVDTAELKSPLSLASRRWPMPVRLGDETAPLADGNSLVQMVIQTSNRCFRENILISACVDRVMRTNRADGGILFRIPGGQHEAFFHRNRWHLIRRMKPHGEM